MVLDRSEKELVTALEQAKEAYRIAKFRYDEGETELMDVLSIQNHVLSSESSLVSVQCLLLEQRVNLNLALGGSW